MRYPRRFSRMLAATATVFVIVSGCERPRANRVVESSPTVANEFPATDIESALKVIDHAKALEDEFEQWSRLADGVYPVAKPLFEPGARDQAIQDLGEIVELQNILVDEGLGRGKLPAPMIAVHSKPLLLFEELSHFDFKFENQECTEIGFDNNEKIKAYTTENPGNRLAVVVQGMVISHHKIQEPITSGRLRITCCTEGGGDHLFNYLSNLKMISNGDEDDATDEI